MSYAAKYASGFYGPFRDAAESPPQFGDRSQYQMDPANRREALREVEPGRGRGRRHRSWSSRPCPTWTSSAPCVSDDSTCPLAAYQVSGEYAMLHAAAANGWIDLRRCALESLTCASSAPAPT